MSVVWSSRRRTGSCSRGIHSADTICHRDPGGNFKPTFTIAVLVEWWTEERRTRERGGYVERLSGGRILYLRGFRSPDTVFLLIYLKLTQLLRVLPERVQLHGLNPGPSPLERGRGYPHTHVSPSPPLYRGTPINPLSRNLDGSRMSVFPFD